MVFALTKAPMLVEGGGSAEHLPTVFALDLGAAVCMHPFVTAQVRELGIRFVTHLTDERLDTAVYVLVLLEARGGGKGLATLRAGVGSGTDVLRADVTLEVAGVCEHLITVFTLKALATVM